MAGNANRVLRSGPGLVVPGVVLIVGVLALCSAKSWTQLAQRGVVTAAIAVVILGVEYCGSRTEKLEGRVSDWRFHKSPRGPLDSGTYTPPMEGVSPVVITFPSRVEFRIDAADELIEVTAEHPDFGLACRLRDGDIVKVTCWMGGLTGAFFGRTMLALERAIGELG